jgi:hypothetical protein
MSLPTYIIGQDPDHERWFVTRTESPRFVAELVEPDEADDGLILQDGEGMNIRQWIDPPQPSSSIKPFLAEIYDDLCRHEDMRRPTPQGSERTQTEASIPPLDAL